MATDIVIKKIEAADTKQIAEMIFENNLGYWSESDLEQEIDRQDSISLAAVKNKEIVGFVVARLITSHHFDLKINSKNKEQCHLKVKNQPVEIEIYNIAVKKQHWRRGIGKLLIEKLIRNSASNIAAILWLEVRETNFPAINFYKSNDFNVCYKRKNFYINPTEDAIVMKLETLETKD